MVVGIRATCGGGSDTIISSPRGLPLQSQRTAIPPHPHTHKRADTDPWVAPLSPVRTAPRPPPRPAPASHPNGGSPPKRTPPTALPYPRSRRACNQPLPPGARRPPAVGTRSYYCCCYCCCNYLPEPALRLVAAAAAAVTCLSVVQRGP